MTDNQQKEQDDKYREEFQNLFLPLLEYLKRKDTPYKWITLDEHGSVTFNNPKNDWGFILIEGEKISE